MKEALLDSDWISAMQEELNQFERSRVWNLVPKPQNRTVIGTKWVLEIRSMNKVKSYATKLGWLYTDITKKKG